MPVEEKKPTTTVFCHNCKTKVDAAKLREHNTKCLIKNEIAKIKEPVVKQTPIPSKGKAPAKPRDDD